MSPLTFYTLWSTKLPCGEGYLGLFKGFFVLLWIAQDDEHGRFRYRAVINTHPELVLHSDDAPGIASEMISRYERDRKSN